MSACLSRSALTILLSVPPLCQAQSCPILPILNNTANISVNTRRRVGDSVLITCLPGYEIVGDSTVECLPSLQWSTLPSCNMRCGQPYTVPNSNREVLGHYLNDATVYTCFFGYQLYGNSTIYCEKDGHWSLPPECQGVRCGQPYTVPNSNREVLGHYLNDATVYTCLHGYQLYGNNTIYCKEDGHWSLPPQCQSRSCPELPLIRNVQNPAVSSSLRTVGNSVKIICLQGYEITGNSTVECLSTLQWSTPPSCSRVRCGQPYTVPNSNREVLGHYLNDTTVYTCFHGYQLYGDSTIYCKEDGHWSLPPECHIVTCGLPPQVPKARTKSISGFELGDTIYFECVIGDFISNINYIICQPNGTWSEPPQCRTSEERTTVVSHGAYKINGTIHLLTNNSANHSINHPTNHSTNHPANHIDGSANKNPGKDSTAHLIDQSNSRQPTSANGKHHLRSDSRTGLIVGLCVGITIILASVTGVTCWYMKSRRREAGQVVTSQDNTLYGEVMTVYSFKGERDAAD